MTNIFNLNIEYYMIRRSDKEMKSDINVSTLKNKIYFLWLKIKQLHFYVKLFSFVTWIRYFKNCYLCLGI